MNQDDAGSDDAPLIDQSLQGNSAAFGLLVRRHQGRLYNTLRHVAGSPEEAEDLVQDSFVQAFVKLHTFRGQSAFYTWLYRIAFNQLASRKRRKHWGASIEQHREASGQEPPDGSSGPVEQLMQAEEIQQVHAALGQLPEQQRAILVLREIEGCDYETIAEILELPVGTVRSRLHRARCQLREELKEVFQEYAGD